MVTLRKSLRKDLFCHSTLRLAVSRDTVWWLWLARCWTRTTTPRRWWSRLSGQWACGSASPPPLPSSRFSPQIRTMATMPAFSMHSVQVHLYSYNHKVLTYVEHRAESDVFQKIDPPPPSPPSECAVPPHSPGGEGGGGSIFWKTPAIGLASYNNLSTPITFITFQWKSFTCREARVSD